MQALAASAISSQIWSLWRPSSNNSFSHDLIYYLNSMFGVIWSPWLPSSNTPPSSWPISKSAYALDNMLLIQDWRGHIIYHVIFDILKQSENALLLVKIYSIHGKAQAGGILAPPAPRIWSTERSTPYHPWGNWLAWRGCIEWLNCELWSKKASSYKF